MLQSMLSRAPVPVRVGWSRAVNGLARTVHPPDPRTTLLVVSSPRSGSTWLMNLLETVPGYRSVLEPLNPAWFRGPWEAYRMRHITSADVRGDAELRQRLEDILAGRVRGGYPDHRWTGERLRRALAADRLVVKSVRLPRALPAVAEALPLRHAFHLVRHPGATIASQLRTGFRGYGVPPGEPLPRDVVLAEARRGATVSDPGALEALLSRDRDGVAGLATLWCLDNLALREGRGGDGWSMVRYEDLVLDPGAALSRLFEVLDEEVPPEAWSEVARRSQTTHRDGGLAARELLHGWTERLDDEKVERIAEVLRIFDLPLYGLTQRELVAAPPSVA